MRFILNIVWLIFAGLWLAFLYLLLGLLLCLPIITIPFAIASFRMAAFTLWPFGRAVVPRPGAGGASMIGNVIWFIFAGLWLALAHLTTGIALCVTIIGIPLGLADFKLIPISIAPLGKEIVSTRDPVHIPGAVTF